MTPLHGSRSRFSRRRPFRYALLLGGCLLGSCASRTYTHYLLDVPTDRTEAMNEQGTPLRPDGFGQVSVMKVRWNDGQVFTEVDVPLLASGQQIVIEQGGAGRSGGGGGAAAAPGKGGISPRKVLVPPPTEADKSLVEAYRERGLKENPQSPDVSIVRTRVLLQEAIRAGNYSLALEYAESVLARYPSQPEFLRAKGSILLLMGEREKAMSVYEQAEEIESDPKVKKQLEQMRKQR